MFTVTVTRKYDVKTFICLQEGKGWTDDVVTSGTVAGLVYPLAVPIRRWLSAKPILINLLYLPFKMPKKLQEQLTKKLFQPRKPQPTGTLSITPFDIYLKDSTKLNVRSDVSIAVELHEMMLASAKSGYGFSVEEFEGSIYIGKLLRNTNYIGVRTSEGELVAGVVFGPSAFCR